MSSPVIRINSRRKDTVTVSFLLFMAVSAVLRFNKNLSVLIVLIVSVVLVIFVVIVVAVVSIVVILIIVPVVSVVVTHFFHLLLCKNSFCFFIKNYSQEDRKGDENEINKKRNNLYYGG